MTEATLYSLIIVIILAIIVTFFMMLSLTKKIGIWGIFSKAGISEWKSLIPIYNQIELLKICKLSPWFILLHLDFIIPIIGAFAGRDITWITIIMLIGLIIYRFAIAIRLGYCFKKGEVFPFFTAFFPSVFYPILGCSKQQNYSELVLKKDKKSKNN